MIGLGTWEEVLRCVGGSVVTMLRCPHCRGEGLSPYSAETGERTACECCRGEGWDHA